MTIEPIHIGRHVPAVPTNEKHPNFIYDALSNVPTADHTSYENTVPSLSVSDLGHAVLRADERLSASDEIMAANGGRLRFISYFDGDPLFKDLTHKIVARRQERYKEEGLLKSSAKREDDIRGHNVEIIALVNSDTGAPVASLRKIHAIHTGGVEGLPSYLKFADANAFSESGLNLLKDRAAGRAIVEIGALWKDREYKNDTALALYRKALQESIAKNELWFMGIVTSAYMGLLRTFGPQVVRDIGSPIPVNEEGASEKVRIRPCIVDPATFYDDLMDQVGDLKAKGDYAARLSIEIILWHFLEGLDRNKYLSNATVSRLGRMCSGV